MDFEDVVTQQPVSTLPDLMTDIPSTREEAPAVVEATLPYHAEPVTLSSKLEPVPALAEQNLAMRETPTAVPSQDDLDRTDDGGESVRKLDGNGNVAKAVSSNILADTAVVQQIKETVDIEVDIPAPAEGAESRPLEGTVVVVENVTHEGGHVGLLVEQAGVNSNADGIAVEVVLNEARPAINDAQLLPFGEEGSGLGEISSSVEVEIVGASSNVADNGGSQLSVQTGPTGHSLEIEATVGVDALATVNSPAISFVNGLARAGAGAAVREELDVIPIVELAEEHAEQVLIAEGGDGTISERDSAAVSCIEEGNSVEEPEFTDNLEGKRVVPSVDNSVELRTRDASNVVRISEGEVFSEAVSEGAPLDSVDPFTVDVSAFNAREPERLEAAKTCDHIVDVPKIADDALNASDSSVRRMVEFSAVESNLAPKLDDQHPSEDTKADELVDPVIVSGDVAAVSGQDGEIVVELNNPMNPEEGIGMEDVEELRVFAAPLNATGDALHSGGAVTSNEMTISEEHSTIFVQLDSSIPVINSEKLEAVDFPERVTEEKPGKDGATRAGDDSVAGGSALDHFEDASAVAIGMTEAIKEPVVSEPNDSSDFEMAEIRHPSADEPSIVKELGATSENTPIPTSDELLEENLASEEGTAREELPTEEGASLTDVQAISEIHIATERHGDPISSERTKTSETFSVLSVETIAHIPGSPDDANVEEVRIQTTLSTGDTEMSPFETPLNKETFPENFDQIRHIAKPDVSSKGLDKTEAPPETLIPTPADRIQETAAMESAERTVEQSTPTAFQERMTEVEGLAGTPEDKTPDSVINAVETTAVVKEEDTEMVSAPSEGEAEGQVAFTVTVSSKPEDGIARMDDQINPPVSVVAIEETIETTLSSVTPIREDTGEAAAATEDVDGKGVLIGVGSSVESSGLTITEIAETSVIVEGFQAERQTSWALSEPLITPPEEEIIDAIGDLIDDSILDTEPETVEGWVLVEDDPVREFNLQTVSVEGTPSELEASGIENKNQETTLKDVVLDDVEQPEKNTNDTVLVAIGDEGEPYDFQDERSVLTTSIKTDSDNGILASPAVSNLAESKQPADVEVEITSESGAELLQHNVAPGVVEVEDAFRVEEAVVSRPSVESLEALCTAEAVDSDQFPASDTGPVSIAMSSSDAEKLLSIDESAPGLFPDVLTVDEDDNSIAEGACEVLVPSADILGHDLEAAVDGLVPKGIVSEGGVAPVEPDMERSEKKRGREEEGTVAEDEEKTAKAAKTVSNGENSVLNDAELNDVKVEEDVQVLDKKRPRDDLATEMAKPDVSLQTKVQKTGSPDDDAPSQVRKGDSLTEAEERVVDIEEKEGVQEKSTKGVGQPKYKKRKIAMFLGYSGAGYQGMQKNPGAFTIEGELEDALFRAGAIAESNYGQPQKLDWTRAARTDKGVSAVGQVVSGCFFIDPPGFIDRVNSHLPKQIRVYGYKRATASFNARKLCDRRKYEYVLPVYAFDPTVHLDREAAQALAAADKLQSVTETQTVTSVSVETVSAAAGETEASEISDGEMNDDAITPDDGDVSGPTIAVTPNVEGKEENQACSNGTCSITEEVTVITDVTQEDGATGGTVETQEVLTEQKDVSMVSDFAMEAVEVSIPVQAEEVLLEANDVTASKANPEAEEALNGKSSSAMEVLVQAQEVVTEHMEVTVSEAVAEMSTEEKKDALDEKVKMSTYKFGDAEFDRLNKILRGFEGHHNFHNFTARKKATDPSANRFIISFGVEDTFTIDGMEFVRCSVVGQSFMLHQIRKMIGLAVAIMRGTAPESILATALRRDIKINVPMAPELGLFLEECYYSAYNREFHATHEDMSLSSFADEVKEFKKEFIYPHIVATEARDSTFAMWLHSLNDRHYPDFVTAREAEKLGKTE